MLTIYNKITCTHVGWGGMWREGRSRAHMLHFDLHSPRTQHSQGTLGIVQKTMTGARRTTEPRGGPSSVTPKNAS
jgi:hypothetical protein